MEEYYKEYSNLVYNYINSLCSNPTIAEELTQETFYKAVKGIHKFNNECKLSTWLCRIAKNTWIDYLRKEGHKQYVSIDDTRYIEKLIAEEHALEDKEDIINLYKYIHKFDEVTKEIFYLRLKGELSFKDIAEILDKSPNWVRTVFYRGKLKLKEAMKDGM